MEENYFVWIINFFIQVPESGIILIHYSEPSWSEGMEEFHIIGHS